MSKCIEHACSELYALGVVQSWDATNIWEVALEPCQSCRSRGKRSGARTCRGWHLKMWGRHGVVFTPVELDESTTIRVQLEGEYSTRRDLASSGEWTRTPFQAVTSVVTVFDGVSEELLCRQHLDLANVDPPQPGSTWHLQLGGIGGDVDRKRLRTVSRLRWPATPTDFILSLEMCLYLFYNVEWRSLCGRNPWKSYIKKAERQALSHYSDELSAYLDQSERADSWLKAQCNEVGRMNPRP